jgi:Mn-dependent DtxR family transcriptional regulator
MKNAPSDRLRAILEIIQKKPGIRPGEINAFLGIKHSAHLRDELIKQGLIRKERRGAAVHYYPIHAS